MAAPSVLGSAFTLAIVNNSSVSVTVPTTCDGVLLVWEGHNTSDPFTSLASMTLDGKPAQFVVQQRSTNTGLYACGAAVVYAPTIGAQTLAWDWEGTNDRIEAGAIYLAYLNGTNPYEFPVGAAISSTTQPLANSALGESTFRNFYFSGGFSSNTLGQTVDGSETSLYNDNVIGGVNRKNDFGHVTGDFNAFNFSVNTDSGVPTLTNVVVLFPDWDGIVPPKRHVVFPQARW
jgi:hypothetical protein